MFHDEQTPGHDGKVPALARVTVLRIGTVKRHDSADSLRRQAQLCGRPSALARFSPVGGLEDRRVGRKNKPTNQHPKEQRRERTS